MQIDEDSTPTTEYLLDALGKRVAKQPYGTPASATHYHYALDGMLLAESEADGDPTLEYIVLPGVGAAGLPLAFVPDPLGDPDELAFIHADHLGQAQAITDGSQAIDWDLVAGPFGELEDLTASLTYNSRLPGQYADAETGYRYNTMRDYDPAIGRYLQSDPIGLEGGLNTYAYVEGDPVNRTDPTGQFVAALPPVLTAGGAILDGLLLGLGFSALLMDEEPCEDDDCDEHFVSCLMTSLADKPGSVFGQNRCGFCREVCVREGEWPSRAPTTRGSVRCDYWNYSITRFRY